ncbi:MAG: Signal recognition particle core component [Bogoriella megaspora]|nr:MAG: Signal recognition particle core component [Bogoriella megaspora]
MAAVDLAAILRRTTIDDHAEVLDAATATLQKSKGNLDAQHAQIVALLKLDRFEDALRVLETAGDKLKERAQLEHAYALYKAGRLDDAELIAKNGGTSQIRALQHVRAQVAYRAEAFEKAAQLYKDLRQRPDGEESDLRINTRAVDAQLEWSGNGHRVDEGRKKPSREDLEAFETAYNAACACIARGELAAGEVLLKRAKDLCNALEDLSEDEKQAEILPITVQQVYVLARQGKYDQAESLGNNLNTSKTTEQSTRHIAQVNSLAAQQTIRNPYLAQRMFQESGNGAGMDALFKFQSSTLDEDALVIDLLSLKHDGVFKSTKRALTAGTLPTLRAPTNALAVLNAAARAKSEIGKTGIKLLLPLLEQRPNDVGLLLTIIQLYVSTNNPASAINLLESFFKRLSESGDSSHQDVRYAPGLVATLISLYSMQGRKSHIRTELVKAASYWRHRSKESTGDGSLALGNLLRAAGMTILENAPGGDLQLAAEIFNDLHRESPSDRFANAGLVAASSSSGTPEAIDDNALSSLIPVQRLIANVDVDALERAGIPQPPSSFPVTTSKKRKAEDDATKKPKKLHKCKIPKDYDPANPPKLDPERWLPMKERSYWKPKKKRGRGGGGAAQGATQGGIVAEEKGKERDRTPDVKPSTGGSGAAAKKKKKGKGTKF